jgi:putative nucleotidyltransferase with HDIG domain
MPTEISRDHIIQDLPEIELIRSRELREKVIDAWAFALGQSSFRRVTDIPGEWSPGVFRLHVRMQDAHLRGVANLACKIADEFEQTFPEVDIDRDVLMAGALIHDVGKTWEFDPINQKRWAEKGDRYGSPSYRHPFYGAYVCLSVGLPEEIAYIAGGHSFEGQHIGLSTECYIIRQADNMWWHTAAALGLCQEGTTSFAGPGLRIRPLAPERSAAAE